MKTVVVTIGQAIILAAIGVGIGFGVNALGGARHIAAQAGIGQDRDDHIAVTRDYFGGKPAPVPQRPVTNGSPNGPTATVPAPTSDQGDEEPPYQIASLADVIAFFKDERTSWGGYVFVDARATESFEEGRIPGAVQCDYYRLDSYLGSVLDVVVGAEKVIVYCNGKECEDSLHVCGELLNQQVPWESIYLFKGGWEAWSESGQAIQAGPAE